MSNVLRSVLTAFALVVGVSLGALAQAPKQAPQQQTFPTAEAAADAMVDALRKNDDKATAAMLGAGWREFVQGTPEEEDKQRADFLAAWDAAHKVVADGDKATISGRHDRLHRGDSPDQGGRRLALRRRCRPHRDQGTRDRPQRARRGADPARDRRRAAGLLSARPDEDRRRDLRPPTAELARQEGRTLLGDKAGRAREPARRRWSRKPSRAPERATGTTATNTASCTVKGRRRRAAPTAISSTAA